MTITAEELARKQREFEDALARYAESNGGEVPFDVAEGSQRIAKSLSLEESDDDVPQVNQDEEDEVAKGLRTELEQLRAENARLKGTPAPLKNQTSHKAPTQAAVRPVAQQGETSLSKALKIASDPLKAEHAAMLERVHPVDLMKLCMIRGEKNGHLRAGSLTINESTKSFLASVVG